MVNEIKIDCGQRTAISGWPGIDNGDRYGGEREGGSSTLAVSRDTNWKVEY